MAVDAATGATRWRVQAAASAGSDSWSMTAFAGVVLAAMRPEGYHPAIDLGGNGLVVALSAADGSALWQRAMPEGEFGYNWLASFVDGPPSVIFCTQYGRPMRYRLCDGTDVWTGSLPELESGEKHEMSTGGMALGGDGLAFVTSNTIGGAGQKNGRVTAYHTATGEVAWSRRTEMPANVAPAVGHLRGPDGGLSVVVALGENAGFPNALVDALGERWPDGRPVEWFGEASRVLPSCRVVGGRGLGKRRLHRWTEGDPRGNRSRRGILSLSASATSACPTLGRTPPSMPRATSSSAT